MAGEVACRVERVDGRFSHHTPLKECKEATVALHQGIMLKHAGQRLLVKGV